MNKNNILSQLNNDTLGDLIDRYSFIEDFLSRFPVDLTKNRDKKFSDLFSFLDDDIEQENYGISKADLLSDLALHISQVLEFMGEDGRDDIQSISIIAGNNKLGEAEKFDKIEIKKSEIICIVGPTGSGKSRLLADIEWIANCDTPTNRKILINDDDSNSQRQKYAGNKLVAQLSQNMNFIMDLSVYEFLELHAQSRMVENPENIIDRIIEQANILSGEKFDKNSQITGLSGGQSRALMIADTAILSKSPIILIDEIENAGIDRKKALDLLINEEKIVLMATHDPILALMGDRRIVIKNGGIDKIINTKESERNLLKDLHRIDDMIQGLRHRIRNGSEIQKSDLDF
ncbi:MAG: ATP-binding cassette domain-containing protein [Marinifilaceae bacterium]|jgi:ABC-type lipoprotein export system ATPase subunit|nr:ATP-binding cassette domain-containing protein [Marinifilaceae bacterium]